MAISLPHKVDENVESIPIGMLDHHRKEMKSSLVEKIREPARKTP
jgi:hypothetical protein